MAVSNFIKQNFVLLLGIALPALLVVGFMITASMPQKMGPRPQYPVLFTVYSYANDSAPYNVEYIVKADKLYARLTARKNEYGASKRDLYLFDAQKDSVTKIDTALPDDIGDDKQRDVPVADFAQNIIDKSSKSPDGYTLENGSYRSRGIVGELFGGRSGYYESSLRHDDGWRYKIPAHAGNNYNYSNLEFIGWVKPAGAE